MVAEPQCPREVGGFTKAEAYPARAKFKCGGGRMGKMGFAAGTPAGIEALRGRVTAFLAGAEIPALLFKGALVALRGKLECARNSPRREESGVQAPLRSNAPGRCVSSVASCGKEGGPVKAGRTAQSVSRSSSNYDVWVPDMPNGGVRFPILGDGPRQFGAPRIMLKNAQECLESVLRGLREKLSRSFT